MQRLTRMLLAYSNELLMKCVHVWACVHSACVFVYVVCKIIAMLLELICPSMVEQDHTPCPWPVSVF